MTPPRIIDRCFDFLLHNPTALRISCAVLHKQVRQIIASRQTWERAKAQVYRRYPRLREKFTPGPMLIVVDPDKVAMAVAAYQLAGAYDTDKQEQTA